MHYQRWRKWGDLTRARRTGAPRRDPVARFFAKMNKTSGCWNWIGSTLHTGYGVFWLADVGQNVMAHRFSYELIRGAIPAGLTLDHLCRNRACVNPDHLEPVTSAENTMRGTGVGATNAAKETCKYGHPFDAANTRICTDGSRSCRTCSRIRMAAFRAKRKAGN